MSRESETLEIVENIKQARGLAKPEWITHSDGLNYLKFYMGMIFCDGHYYDKDDEGNWYFI